jgi:hypothetical protein
MMNPALNYKTLSSRGYCHPAAFASELHSQGNGAQHPVPTQQLFC